MWRTNKGPVALSAIQQSSSRSDEWSTSLPIICIAPAHRTHYSAALRKARQAAASAPAMSAAATVVTMTTPDMIAAPADFGSLAGWLPAGARPCHARFRVVT